jgi:hypothetical protein
MSHRRSNSRLHYNQWSAEPSNCFLIRGWAFKFPKCADHWHHEPQRNLLPLGHSNEKGKQHFTIFQRSHHNILERTCQLNEYDLSQYHLHESISEERLFLLREHQKPNPCRRKGDNKFSSTVSIPESVPLWNYDES